MIGGGGEFTKNSIFNPASEFVPSTASRRARNRSYSCKNNNNNKIDLFSYVRVLGNRFSQMKRNRTSIRTHRYDFQDAHLVMRRYVHTGCTHRWTNTRQQNIGARRNAQTQTSCWRLPVAHSTRKSRCTSGASARSLQTFQTSST